MKKSLSQLQIDQSFLFALDQTTYHPEKSINKARDGSPAAVVRFVEILSSSYSFEFVPPSRGWESFLRDNWYIQTDRNRSDCQSNIEE
ncbi:hypothetical protein D3C76_1691490 [compost metagenome]